MSATEHLTVAVTGATGTIGRGLLPWLESDDRIARVISVSSRDWSPAEDGLTKVEHRRADVRDPRALARAFDAAHAVVHLAFSLYGLRQRASTLWQINVEGSKNVLWAAAAAGARRFVYTSSAAVYGFETDRPTRVDEDAPVVDGSRHFYVRQKAAVERGLRATLERLPDIDWTFLRPCAVVGPHALGAASHAVPEPLARLTGAVVAIGASAGLRPAVPGPPVALQFVHARDVGQALHLAVITPKTRGIFNLAGDGMVEGAEIPRLLGLRTLPVAQPLSRIALRAAAGFPYGPPALRWLQLLTQPLELDTSRARRELGWSPDFSSRDALASTRRALGI